MRKWKLLASPRRHAGACRVMQVKMPRGFASPQLPKRPSASRHIRQPKARCLHFVMIRQNSELSKGGGRGSNLLVKRNEPGNSNLVKDGKKRFKVSSTHLFHLLCGFASPSAADTTAVVTAASSSASLRASATSSGSYHSGYAVP
jgi:hypothetical protein